MKKKLNQYRFNDPQFVKLSITAILEYTDIHEICFAKS